MPTFSHQVAEIREFLADRFLEGYRLENGGEPEASYERARETYLHLIDDMAPEFGGDEFYRHQVRRESAHPEFRPEWLVAPAPAAGERTLRSA